MTTLQLKKILIQEISEIDDKAFLNALKTIIDLKLKSKILELTPEQKKQIYKSQEEVGKGLFVAEDDLNQEFKSWVEKK